MSQHPENTVCNRESRSLGTHKLSCWTFLGKNPGFAPFKPRDVPLFKLLSLPKLSVLIRKMIIILKYVYAF